MNEKLNRRALLKKIGAVSVAGSVTGTAIRQPNLRKESPASSSIQPRRSSPDSLVELAFGKMRVRFDKNLGTLYSITKVGDQLGTNFLGNSENTDGTHAGDTHWTGDVVATVWKLETADWVREMPTQPGVRLRRWGRWQNDSIPIRFLKSGGRSVGMWSKSTGTI